MRRRVRQYGGARSGWGKAVAGVVLVLLAVCGGERLGAQGLRLSEFQKSTWQVEQGLPENNVRMVAQEPNGMLLVATSAGLVSFDGQHFEQYRGLAGKALANAPVNALVYGRGRDLWIGTDGEGVLHETSAGLVNISEAAGRRGERVRMLHLQSHAAVDGGGEGRPPETDGALWIATQNGVERYEHGRLEAIGEGGMIAGGLISPFAEDGGGGMFYLTSAGLFHWREGAAERVPLRREVGDATALLRDAAGQIWLGSSTGVWRLMAPAPGSAEGGWRAEATGWGTPAGGLGSEVTTMLADPDGSLWIGTRHDGLWRKSLGGMEHWDSKDGLAENTIRALFLDDERDLWIGMLAGGLSRWRKAAMAPYGEPESFVSGLASTPFADSRGDLWLGSWGKGLFRRHAGRLEAMPLPGAPATEPIRALAEDRAHQVWVGTWYHGVYRWDGTRFTHYLLGTESPGNAVSVLLPDGAGALWVGTYEGVLRYQAGVPAAGQGELLLPHHLVTTMLEDSDGSVLVGTGDGLYRVRGAVVSEIGGLPQRHVVSLASDSAGGVWVSTRAGGLASVTEDRVQQLPDGSGVPSLPVNTMVEDRSGSLWLGTARGLARVEVAALHRLAEGGERSVPVVVLDRADGMRSSECSGSSRPLSTRMPDGTLWFATTKGFVHTTAEATRSGATTPVADIRGWALSNDAGNAQLLTGSRVTLRAGESDILLFFWAKELANPTQIEFRYRLAGYDRDWTPTQARVARYRRLSPGRYTFEVQARNAGGAWTTPVASLAIEQRPHFYQTVYLLVLCLAGLGVATWYYLRRRIAREKGSMGIVLQERNRIAQECHDTLMAGFAAVSWQLEATGKLLAEGGSTSEQAAESFALARSMVALCQAEARRIIWDLRDTNEVTNSLSKALSRMLEVNHVEENAETSLEVTGAEIALPPGCVHHLTCIGQEAVANALRHGQPKRVEVTVRYDEEALLLRILDDGSGFHSGDRADSRRGHFGISVMEERARKVGGTFRLQSRLGEGTEVTVSVPFDAMQLPMQQEENVLRWIGI